MYTKTGISASLRAAAALLAVACMLAFAACGSDDESEGGDSAAAGSGSESAGGAQDFGFIDEGKLTVGMNLQFKPQMYLEDGEPAGYDVELLNELAPDLGAELAIENLDFNGLIPGLQTNKFDMVSVGLSATPERKEAVDFTRAYVPYALVLAVPPDAPPPAAPEDFNQSGKVITALQGSTGEQLAKELFPEAKVNGFPDQNAAFLEVATGRADGIVVEDYLLAQFQESNPDQLEKAGFDEPLDVQYGSWAVPKGNEDFVAYLDEWLCAAQDDGTLERLYTAAFSVDEFPPMPPC